MQAVSFMYVRPPGYNAESAKAAEMNDEKKREDMSKEPQRANVDDGPSSSIPQSSLHLSEERKKPRPKDVFGRPLPTEEEFEVLKNAPRLETGVPARVKPFGVEVRNVKCLRCGNYGHQSGDRECPLKDAIMPSEESRLKRDDPLNAILAHTDPTEPLRWELKQKPGISPPRGGFKPDDPNQQIVAEDIFDEYGGFLGMDNIPELLTNFSKKPKKSKKSKRKRQQQVNSESEESSDDGERKGMKKKVKISKKKCGKSSSSETSVPEQGHGNSRHKSSYSSEDSDSYRNDRSRSKRKGSFSPKGSEHPKHCRSNHGRRKHSFSPEGSGPDEYHRSYKSSYKHYSSEDSDSHGDDRSKRNIQKHKRKHSRKRHSYSDEYYGPAGDHANHKSRDELSYSSDDTNHRRQLNVKRGSHKLSSTVHCDSQKHNGNYGFDRYKGSQKSSSERFCSSEDSEIDKDDRRFKRKHYHTPKGSEHPESDMNKQNRKKQRYSSKDYSADGYHRSERSRYERSYSSDDSDHREKHKSRRSSHKH
ncbi:uncharacterized zinc finger CCHC domain-containing protein At4g19190 isoform X2 [Abrus precatorius]|nr:uncharacterized zinc finger CCHC domain-containing protein At4g19190 isoform X2 [Abrus precatorius]